MKKILIIIGSMKLGGGAQTIAATLGNELGKRGHEVEFLTFYDLKPLCKFDGKYVSFDEKLGKSVTSRIYSLFQRARKIKRYCRENNIDTAISFIEEANFPTALSKILGNKSRVIVSIHGDTIKDQKRREYRLLIKHTYPKCDLVVTVSKNIERSVQKLYGLKNTMTIYNGHDIKSALKKCEEELPTNIEGLFDSSFVFVNVGRLTRQKGQWHLIRAFKKVLETDDAKLIILGEGDLRTRLEKLVSDLGLEENVFLPGNQKNIYPILKKSDCFVFSSLWEGFPMVLAEALLTNIPVISTDCNSGPRETLSPTTDIEKRLEYPAEGEYGILVKPFKGDSWEGNLSFEEQMLADEMKKIIGNKELRKRYSRGLERAKELDIGKITDIWESVI